MIRIVAICFATICSLNAQNALNIPTALTGTTFILDIKSGISSFYQGTTTPTYGINGIWMAPTLIVNKGDSITLNVHNGLNTTTTMHWHGLHVAPENDGGPAQIIDPKTTWSPSFNVRNNAGTYWYHPHGINKTEIQVSKGLAGMLIVKDSLEEALALPKTYGIDDIPIIIQTKDFDILTQIAIATTTDTALFVNGTLNPYLNIPAQVTRLRLLNGSSMRTYNIGFSGNLAFKMIAGDGGLLDSPISLNRIRISPGERIEILIDLQGLKGQSLYLKNYGSELADGIIGAKNVGHGSDTITDYHLNPLNGKDYNILKLNVVPATKGAITTIPKLLIKSLKWDTNLVIAHRTFLLNADSANVKAEGPFNINGHKFSMDTINVTTYKNNLEIWTWINKTYIAHPIHLHDVHFFVLDINRKLPPVSEQGKKDVILVMPEDTLRFITKFEDFADTMPYMYHCHLLHHEDDGMMGQFVVLNTTIKGAVQSKDQPLFNFNIFPNPSKSSWNISGNIPFSQEIHISIFNALTLESINSFSFFANKTLQYSIKNDHLIAGTYLLKISYGHNFQTFKVVKL